MKNDVIIHVGYLIIASRLYSLVFLTCTVTSFVISTEDFDVILDTKNENI